MKGDKTVRTLTKQVGLSRVISATSMQQRLGLETDVERHLSDVQGVVDEELGTILDPDTPPPDWLSQDAKDLWILLLTSAHSMHFKKTEVEILSQYCWATVGLRSIQRQSDPLFMEKEDVTKMAKFQDISTRLACKLRLSPVLANTMIETKKKLADEQREAEMFAGATGASMAREGMMFGEGSDELQ